MWLGLKLKNQMKHKNQLGWALQKTWRPVLCGQGQSRPDLLKAKAKALIFCLWAVLEAEDPIPGSPWARPQKSLFWYYVRWQSLVVFFIFLCVSGMYFHMIDLAEW